MQNKTINGFTLQRLLGTGGMAEVWYAENKIGKKAAVKLLLPKLCQDENVVSRFLTEAKVMVELNHPNIRQVYDYGDIDGRPAIVMEYLDGTDLKAKLKRGQRFTQEELVKWWNQLVDALNYTHKKDIVHRDIKPSNIFIDQKGNAKLLDFGIAKVADTTTGTQTGSTLGTRIYMSPEQVKDPKRVGTASDVYSLAVSFVHLLTGKAPYNSTTSSDYEIQVSIVTKPVDMSKVPEEWRVFLTPYLNKEADNRPALRYYELVNPEEKAAKHTDDDTTLAENKKQVEVKPVQKSKQKVNKGQKAELDDKNRSKRILWIALGATAMAALFMLFLKTKQEPDPTDPDTETYEACQTVADYRAYMRQYGTNALYYADAQRFVEEFVTDSTAKVKEDAAYGQCTTIAACVSYLKDYPQGRYVADVRKKKAELEQAQQTQQSGNGSANGHEWVDLDLPSGTLWATCNIGANKPEGYGDYYAWGETSTKRTYSWSTYRYSNGNTNKLTKYCSKYDCGNNGFTDNLTALQTGDDPASAIWGNGWCTPTRAQWDELLSNTTNQYTTKNGVKGCFFTSKKNSQTLFLPAAGYHDDNYYNGVKSSGRYWSSTLRIDIPIYSWYLDFNSGHCYIDFGYRNYGRSVRPVRQK